MYDLDLFFNKLSVLKDTPLFERNSLVILDEIQCFPWARQMIKKLVSDGRYDYIETGSLLSIKTNIDGILIPSEEIHMTLQPLDFEEFLWGMGDRTSIPYVKKCFEERKPVGTAIHKHLMNRYREYLLVGGMPGAVSRYADTRDFALTDHVKKSILTLYRSDIPRFAKGYEKKVVSIFDEIPAQLSKKEKRFTLSSVDKNARMRTYEEAFMWLADGMIVNQCFDATDPTVGLSMNLDSTKQKCYMADTGLLVTHALFDRDYADKTLYKSILLEKVNVNEGLIVENSVAQTLRAKGDKLFFYSKPAKTNDDGSVDKAIEIDFLIVRDGKVCPVEVKSSGYMTHSSLDRFRKKFGKRLGQAYVICEGDVKEKDGVLYIPFYMASVL
jgi:predicted AAA+ superfamily ATPase